MDGGLQRKWDGGAHLTASVLLSAKCEAPLSRREPRPETWRTPVIIRGKGLGAPEKLCISRAAGDSMPRSVTS